MRIFGFNMTKRSVQGNRPVSPLDDRWYVPFSFTQPSASGAIVNPSTALAHPTVYACVKVIAETVAAMPLVLYKRGRQENTKERASEHDLFRILKTAPNPRMTAFEFWEMLVGHYLLRGNAYAQIILSNDGSVNSLWPLHPARMEVVIQKDETDNEVVIYKYQLTNGQTVLFNAEQIFHLRGPSDTTLVGRSPIECFKESIGLGLSMDTYLSTFYGNNAAPAGILTLPAGQALSPKAKDRLREDWNKKFSGAVRAGNIAVLEDGVTWQQVGMSSADAQYAETEKNNDLKIARCFRMPPHKIGILDKATYSNIEFQGIEFYTDTMLPHLRRIEHAVTRDLLRKEKPEKFFAEFLVDAILRGDIVSRYRAYAVARQWGWLSVNDIRSKENENPVEGGDIYLQPLNMIEASKATELLLSDSGNTNQPGTKQEQDNNDNPVVKNDISDKLLSIIEERLLAAKLPENSEKPAKIEEKPEESGVLYDNSFGKIQNSARTLFADILDPILRKETNAIKTARKKGTVDQLEKDFYDEHREFTKERLRPAVGIYLEQVRFLAALHHRSSISDSKVHGTVTAVLDRFVNQYYASYRDCGERIVEISHELGVLLSQQIEQIIARGEVLAPIKPDDFSEEKAGERTATVTVEQKPLTLHLIMPDGAEREGKSSTKKRIEMTHNAQGRRVFDVYDLDKGEK